MGFILKYKNERNVSFTWKLLLLFLIYLLYKATEKVLFTAIKSKNFITQLINYSWLL